MKKFNYLKALMPISTMILAPISFTSCSQEYKNNNPHKDVTDNDIIKSLESIKRVDKDGYLYFMENSIDYYNNAQINDTLTSIEQTLKHWDYSNIFHDACSAFCAKDAYNTSKMLTGRAYDYSHWYTEESRNVISTGANLMIHTPKSEAKKIKYESIGTCDTYLLFEAMKTSIRNGSLDDNKTDLSLLSFSPWIVMDGINDQGLTASILELPLDINITNDSCKEEESSAITLKRKSTSNGLGIERTVRYILDNCATCSEAEQKLSTIWFNRLIGANFHVLVTDKNGESRLFEWYMDSEDSLEQKFCSIKTNVATNFYETFSKCLDGMPQLTNLKNKYHYGYCEKWTNVVYDRFNSIASMLDFFTPIKSSSSDEFLQSEMPEQTVDALLRSVTLCPTSYNFVQTQYSILFDSNNLTEKIYSFADLSKSWTYSLKEHKFI